MNSTKKVGISVSFYAMQVIELVSFSNAAAGFGDEDTTVKEDTGFGSEVTGIEKNDTNSIKNKFICCNSYKKQDRRINNSGLRNVRNLC